MSDKEEQIVQFARNRYPIQPTPEDAIFNLLIDTARIYETLIKSDNPHARDVMFLGLRDYLEIFDNEVKAF